MVNVDVQVNNVTYYNQQNNYSILKCENITEKKKITVVGYFTNPTKGQYMSITGKYEENKAYGQQLRVKSYKLKEPTSKQSLITYLSSGICKGIGAVTAKKIVDKIENTDSIIDLIISDPQEATKITGVKGTLMNDLSQALHKERSKVQTITRLMTIGFGQANAHSIYNVYGVGSIGVVEEYIFDIIKDVRGVGFKTIDAIAIKSGRYRAECTERISAGAYYVVSQISGGGHSCIKTESLINNLAKLLGLSKEAVTINLPDKVRGLVHEGGVWLLKSVYDAEKYVADWINKRRTAHSRDNAEMIAQLRNIDSKFNAEQVEAIRNAITYPVSIITGKAGTGKTTTIKALVDMASQCSHKEVCALIAPTGKASSRLAMVTGHEAKTIHRAIGLQDDGDKPKQKLSCRYCVIDECSMIDIRLMASLLMALPDKVSLIMVGDHNQLPPVGAGSLFGEAIAAGIKTVELVKPQRQKEGGNILSLSEAVLTGDKTKVASVLDKNTDEDKVLIHHLTDVDSMFMAIKNHWGNSMPTLITGGNKGLFGAQNLNKVAQNLINPEKEGESSYMGFRLNDPVMQIENDYEIISGGVFNGEMGVVEGVYSNGVTVNFGDKVIRYAPENICGLQLGYALTVHKSQGSEYSDIVMILSREHYILFNKSLLYTGITRAKKTLMLCADFDVFYSAIGKNRSMSSNCMIKLLTNGGNYGYRN